MLKEKLLEFGFIDNEYMKKYIQLIEYNKNNIKKKGITQSHHVIPICCYKSRYNLKNRTEAENKSNFDNNFCINLTYIKHIEAHYYLCLCCGENSNKFRLENAFIKMTNRRYKIENFNIEKDLEQFKNIYNDYIKRSSEAKKGNITWMKGKKHTEEANEKNRKKHLGKHNSPKTEFKKGEHKCPEYEFKKGQESLFKGHHHTEESKEKLRKIRLGINLPEEVKEKIRKSTKTRKAFFQCDKNYNIIKKWTCAKEVKRDGKFLEREVRRCLKHKAKTYRGYIWIYVEEYNNK